MRFWRGVWRIADPRITLASVASMTLGAAAAARDGPLSWQWLGLTVLAVVLIERRRNEGLSLLAFLAASLGMSAGLLIGR
jgi:hypothetical protein